MELTRQQCPDCGALVTVEGRQRILACAACQSSVALTLVRAETQGTLASRGRLVPLNPRFLARYQVIRSLGHGVSGTVYLAWDTERQGEVALKILEASVDSPIGRRFVREAEILSRLKHANVVQMLDLVTLGEFQCLVTEYVPGGSLRDELNRRGRFPYQEAAGLTMEILAGLSRCHAEGLVHRDVKPENILLDGQGRAKVADFGLIKGTDEGTDGTHAGLVVGTPRYMAPEQFRGEEIGPAADLYAVGLILFELIVGQPAHPVTGMVQLLAARTKPPVFPQADMPSGLPPELLQIIRMALDPMAARRPASAQYFSNQLQRICQSNPLVIREGAASGGAIDARWTDEELLAQAARGTETAFEELVRRHQGRIWRMAWSMVGDPVEAQDIAQTAFLRILSNLSVDRPIRNFISFARTVVVRLCQDHLEKKAPERVPQLDHVAGNVSSVSNQVGKIEVRGHLRSALEQLPVTQRVAVILKYAQSCSTAEVAAALQLTPKAVERMLAKARHRLASMLEEFA